MKEKKALQLQKFCYAQGLECYVDTLKHGRLTEYTIVVLGTRPPASPNVALHGASAPLAPLKAIPEAR